MSKFAKKVHRSLCNVGLHHWVHRKRSHKHPDPWSECTVCGKVEARFGHAYVTGKRNPPAAPGEVIEVAPDENPNRPAPVDEYSEQR